MSAVLLFIVPAQAVSDSADAHRKGSGFGIGLSIARSISEGHHGSIRAIVDDGKIAFTAELK